MSQDALFRVLRQRLGYINVLPYIIAFNQRTADEQLNFMLADDDRKQWQVSDSQIFFLKQSNFKDEAGMQVALLSTWCYFMLIIYCMYTYYVS